MQTFISVLSSSAFMMKMKESLARMAASTWGVIEDLESLQVSHVPPAQSASSSNSTRPQIGNGDPQGRSCF